jgi:hypothetical protein
LSRDTLSEEATKYQDEQYDLALAAVMKDSMLMEGFTTLKAAAQYMASVIGTTTYQRQAVTHNLLRAASTGDLSRLLRNKPPALPAGAVFAEAEALAASRAAEAEKAALEEAEAARAAALTPQMLTRRATRQVRAPSPPGVSLGPSDCCAIVCALVGARGEASRR